MSGTRLLFISNNPVQPKALHDEIDFFFWGGKDFCCCYFPIFLDIIITVMTSVIGYEAQILSFVQWWGNRIIRGKVSRLYKMSNHHSDRSQSWVICEARDDSRKALKIIYKHYLSKREVLFFCFSMYSKLNKSVDENINEYIIWGEKKCSRFF